MDEEKIRISGRDGKGKTFDRVDMAAGTSLDGATVKYADMMMLKSGKNATCEYVQYGCGHSLEGATIKHARLLLSNSGENAFCDRVDSATDFALEDATVKYARGLFEYAGKNAFFDRVGSGNDDSLEGATVREIGALTGCAGKDGRFGLVKKLSGEHRRLSVQYVGNRNPRGWVNGLAATLLGSTAAKDIKLVTRTDVSQMAYDTSKRAAKELCSLINLYSS